MSDAYDYDLIVIGAGTGGNGVARMAAAAGWKVAIIDSLPYGGTCALRGCDPKKMLVAVTEGVDWAQNLKGKGLEARISVDWPDMMAFKRSFTDAMPPRIETGLEKTGVATLHGDARFTGPDTIELNGESLRARHFHIATGARPMTLNIPWRGAVDHQHRLPRVAGAAGPGRLCRRRIHRHGIRPYRETRGSE